MKAIEINVRKSFLVNGNKSFHEFKTKTNNVNKFFMERIEDVKVFADSLNGKVNIEMTSNYLYESKTLQRRWDKKLTAEPLVPYYLASPHGKPSANNR